MNDLLVDRLERHLEHLAEATELHPTPVATLQQRASARQRRRRALTAGLVVAVIGTAGVVAAQHRGTPQPTQTPVVSEVTSTTPSTTEAETTTTEPTTAPPAPPTSGAIDDSSESPTQLLAPGSIAYTSAAPDEWSQGTFPFLANALTADTATLSWIGDLYDHTHVSAVTRSLDGVNWQPIATSPGIEVIGGTDDGDQIALVGYLPEGVEGAGDLVVARSSDGGTSWTTVEVGETLAPEWASGFRIDFMPSIVAMHHDSVTFTVQASATPDWATFPLPDDARTDGFEVVPTGIAVYEPCADPLRCGMPGYPAPDPTRTVVRVVPWSELGIDLAATKRLVAANQRLYVADVTGTVREVDSGEFGPGTVSSLSSTADGFLAVVQRPYAEPLRPAAVLRSDDGIDWTLLAEPPMQVGRAGIVDGRLAVVGSNTADGQESVAIQGEDGSWALLDLDGLNASDPGTWLLMPYESAVGDDGITVAALENIDPFVDGEASISRNGVTITFFDSGFGRLRVVDDATGELIATYEDDGWTGSAVTDPVAHEIQVLAADGSVRAVFTLDDGVAAMSTVPQPPTRFIIVHSDDLVHWSVTTVNDVVDLPLSGLESIGIADGRPVVRLTVDTTAAPDASPYIVVVGTPAG